MALGQRVHAVLTASPVERVREQHRVVERRDVDAVLFHHQQVILDVLPDLQNARIFKQRTQ
jgi:hypothetical protein